MQCLVFLGLTAFCDPTGVHVDRQHDRNREYGYAYERPTTKPMTPPVAVDNALWGEVTPSNTPVVDCVHVQFPSCSGGGGGQ